MNTFDQNVATYPPIGDPAHANKPTLLTGAAGVQDQSDKLPVGRMLRIKTGVVPTRICFRGEPGLVGAVTADNSIILGPYDDEKFLIKAEARYLYIVAADAATLYHANYWIASH